MKEWRRVGPIDLRFKAQAQSASVIVGGLVVPEGETWEEIRVIGRNLTASRGYVDALIYYGHEIVTFVRCYDISNGLFSSNFVPFALPSEYEMLLDAWGLTAGDIVSVVVTGWRWREVEITPS